MERVWRSPKQPAPCPLPCPAQDQFSNSLKRAACGIMDHPLRVFDLASLQEVKGVGPSIAKVRPRARRRRRRRSSSQRPTLPPRAQLHA